MSNILCESCKRQILKHEIQQNIAHCYGCNLYFPLERKATRRRSEIIIPNATDFIRYRIERDQLEIRFRWYRNYDLINQTMFKDEQTVFFGILSFLLNRTVIKVDSKHIWIDHEPLDTLPSIFYKSALIEQLFVKETDRAQRNQTTRKEYGLYAIFKSGKEELWLWGLSKRTLLFMEQEIERVLKISDKHVRNEIIN